MSQQFNIPLARPFTDGGKVQPGSKLTFYLVGTTTLANTYTDSAGTIAHTNPVVADATGEFAAIYLTAARDVKLTDSADAAVWGPTTVTYGRPIEYVTTAAEASVTVVDSSYPPGNVLRYGATNSSVVSSRTAFAAAASLIGTYNTEIPEGQYLLDGAQIEWDVTNLLRSPRISGYGAEIFTSGAISALKVRGKTTPHHGITIEGITVNHRANNTAVAGFEIVGTDHAIVRDCVVEAHGVSAAYAACLIRNETAANNDTGAFWTTVEEFVCRKRSGADVGDITHGIRLQGAANSTRIVRGSLKTCTNAVHITYESGQTYIANGVTINGTAFEGNTNGVRVVAVAAVPIGGLTIMGTRNESLTTFLRLEGATIQPETPTQLIGNYYQSSVTTKLVNANNLYVQDLDSSTAAALANKMFTSYGLTVKAENVSGQALTLIPGGGGRGAVLYEATGASIVGQWYWDGASTDSVFKGIAANLSLQQVKDVLFGSVAAGIGVFSGTGTPEAAKTAAKGSVFLRTDGGYGTSVYMKETGSGNTGWVPFQGVLAGTDTFAAATTKVVTIGPTMPSTNYRVSIGAVTNRTFWVTGKTTTQFTVNAAAANSDAFEWTVVYQP